MVTRLDRSYDQNITRVRTQLLGFAKRYWNGLGSWRDEDYERLLKVLVPRIEAGQQKIADLTDAYIKQLAIEEFGAVRNGLPMRATTEALRGVPANEVYHRPFASAYAELSDGKSVTAAVAAGATRIEDLVTTGLQLAKTHSARETLTRTKFQLFQRVLTGRENCALCVIASTQRYHRGDLLPIHPGCDCGVKAFRGNPDVQVINPKLLESTHAEIDVRLGQNDRGARNLGIGKTTSAGDPISDYTDLIISHEHGELGPVLAWRDQKFTSASDIAALAR